MKRPVTNIMTMMIIITIITITIIKVLATSLAAHLFERCISLCITQLLSIRNCKQSDKVRATE